MYGAPACGHVPGALGFVPGVAVRVALWERDARVERGVAWAELSWQGAIVGGYFRGKDKTSQLNGALYGLACLFGGVRVGHRTCIWAASGARRATYYTVVV